ncbi:YihY/virulence factor BrkB family protein [Nocardioides sp. GXQ0305]|uniref:YihY/virulence factor BrkB family protein n=1 Tax=Nocardioides sp. GXQ0305 TaxID=3423912 RepID=UPI003D7C503C
MSLRADRRRDEATTPPPDAASKPESPGDLHTRSWVYVVRKTIREFIDDECLDLAAALTYYAVLAVFPALLALLSLLGLVVEPTRAIDTALDVLGPLVSPELLTIIEQPLRDLATSNMAGVALLIGVGGALWSASGYVGAFGRAMNRIYEIGEGRPFWKLRPVMLLITLVAVVLSAVVLVMLVVSGPVARSIGDVLGLGDAAVLTWNIAKWPVIALAVMAVVAMLYYATPNVKQPRFRWISVGAAVAIGAWLLASGAFALYLATFASFDKTYGSVAGAIVALLFLWITNLALLLGAELDSELERGRELEAGIAAEAELQLPARDTRNIEKADAKEAQDIERGRELRERAAAQRPANDADHRHDKESST